MTTSSVVLESPPRQLVEDPVANRVRERRLAMGWSLKRLSEATGGLAPSFLFNIENGRKVPSEDVAVRIARALDDSAFEATYRAWARAKSRGRTGRIDHEAMLQAWEQLRNPFGNGGSAVLPEPIAGPVREVGRLRIPVLATPSDPGDGVRPLPEMVINTLSLDPQTYGHDCELARERYARLRRPFAFPLDDEHASRVGLPGSSLAIVTREGADPPDTRAVYVVRCSGRLEPVRGTALAGGGIPDALRAEGLVSSEALRSAVVGRIDLVLPDVRL
jgi:transcriptional regulator with XRE-family HTH domain